jgi:catechol 2,3-dioxygenase
MTTLQGRVPFVSIDPATTIGVVALAVADLDRSVRFYNEAIGLRVLKRVESEAILGAGHAPLLVLQEQPGALPWMTDQMTGLYHFAILVPSRAHLGLWLRHYLSTEYPPPGQGDHIVSEALYLRDPDGHGIEVYRDRPREGWHWENGRVRMGGGPVDIRGMMAEAAATGETWSGLPVGTTIGHVHLQVGDIGQAEDFYHRILGFDVVSGMQSALFVSAGGYHHHFGLNTWHSKGAPPAPKDTATLRFFSLAMPTAEARDAVATRLAAAGVSYQQTGGVVTVKDPWQNDVVLHQGKLRDAAAADDLVHTQSGGS